MLVGLVVSSALQKEKTCTGRNSSS